MKLTKKQKEAAINIMIENQLDCMTYKDSFQLLYYGCLPFKDIPEDEILEYLKENSLMDCI